ncbi:MAG: ABC transporter ATP-binding protein [Ottowia sp.]|nr:ABC transporter ATP-binding protein [Ottowia sp.]
MEIRISGLSKTYGTGDKRVKALNAVDLTIPANSIYTLLGPSGCGKTTLLRCIVGLEQPDAGEIRIGEHVVWSSEQGISVPPEKRGLGMVFQTYAIWPHMSVFDNIAYPLQVAGVARASIRERVGRVLDFVQLQGLGARPATNLSGGQQQRVALARALVAEPRVILFDEPLSNLDAKLREETRKDLKKFLSKLELTAVYVTHDRVEALALSDHIAVLRAGEIVETGAPQDIYFRARSRYVADFIGRVNQIPATVAGHEDGLTLVDTSMGQLACRSGAELARGSEIMLCIRPEQLRLNAATPAPARMNVLTGTLHEIEFVGEVFEANVQIGGERLVVSLDAASDPHAGDEVQVAVAPQHCLLLPR